MWETTTVRLLNFASFVMMIGSVFCSSEANKIHRNLIVHLLSMMNRSIFWFPDRSSLSDHYWIACRQQTKRLEMDELNSQSWLSESPTKDQQCSERILSETESKTQNKVTFSSLSDLLKSISVFSLPITFLIFKYMDLFLFAVVV